MEHNKTNLLKAITAMKKIYKIRSEDTRPLCTYAFNTYIKYTGDFVTPEACENCPNSAWQSLNKKQFACLNRLAYHYGKKAMWKNILKDKELSERHYIFWKEVHSYLKRLPAKYIRDKYIYKTAIFSVIRTIADKVFTPYSLIN